MGSIGKRGCFAGCVWFWMEKVCRPREPVYFFSQVVNLLANKHITEDMEVDTAWRRVSFIDAPGNARGIRSALSVRRKRKSQKMS